MRADGVFDNDMAILLSDLNACGTNISMDAQTGRIVCDDVAASGSVLTMRREGLDCLARWCVRNVARRKTKQTSCHGLKFGCPRRGFTCLRHKVPARSGWCSSQRRVGKR